MAVVFSDTFTAADGTTLQAHDATWVKNTADAPVDLLVQSGGIVLSSGTTASAYINTTAGSLTDQLVECDIVFAAATNGIHSVIARSATAARTYYLARFNAGFLQLYRFEAASVIKHGGDISVSVSVGQTHRLGLRCVGNQISLEWDGVTKIGPITDSTYSSGYPGVRVIEPSTVRLDNFSVDNLAAADTTAPTLTSPTGTATGATSASGTVSTNEANGTLYYLASANASESAATVKAASSQAVSATGSQSVSFTGLAAGATYYAHYVHRDAAGNDSTVASSASFTMSEAGDTTSPTLTGVVSFTGVTQTSYTMSWPAGSDNVAVAGYEYQIGSTAGAWTDAGNNLSAAITGRTAGATETVYVRAYDAAGLRSTPPIAGEVTLLSASTDGTITVGSALYPIKYTSESVLNESGLRATVLDATTLAEVLNTSGVVCSAGVITITDPALVIGNTYHLAVKTAAGWTGFSDEVTAA